jgi:hypothetical protein
MENKFELHAFDSEGAMVKQLFDTETEAYQFASNHSLEVFSVNKVRVISTLSAFLDLK